MERHCKSTNEGSNGIWQSFGMVERVFLFFLFFYQQVMHPQDVNPRYPKRKQRPNRSSLNPPQIDLCLHQLSDRKHAAFIFAFATWNLLSHFRALSAKLPFTCSNIRIWITVSTLWSNMTRDWRHNVATNNSVNIFLVSPRVWPHFVEQQHMLRLVHKVRLLVIFELTS